MITQERLKELLYYDTDTGVFTWASSRRKCKAGAVAGARHKEGYRQIKLDGKMYLAHRLAYLYMTGDWPEDMVDHINGQRDDNRWANLRDANAAINVQNQRGARPGTKTGLLGVSPKRGKFQARILAGGYQRTLGTFDTPEAAHQAYLNAKRELHAGCTI